MKNKHALLMVCVVAAAAILLGGCGQKQESDSDFVVSTKGGGLESMDEECSITVPDPEPDDLSSLALITAEQAQEAALAAYPGATVTEVELDNENGCLVYSIELANDLDVKVDAGNGVILCVESDDGDDENHEDEGDVDDDEEEDEDEDDDNEDGGGK